MGEAQLQAVRTGAFSVPLPAGWSDRTVATLTGPPDGGVVPNVVVTREALCDHMGLSAFAAGWLARLRDELPARELRPVEHLSVDGRRAQARVVAWTTSGLEIVQMAVFLVDPENACIAIVGTSSASSFDGFEAVFRQAVDGFRLLATEGGE